jgi:regulator of sirC expression with transglutaminase-like and TPR domain
MEVSTFQEELKQPTINVPRAALSFARSVAFPNIDVGKYLNRLDEMAEAVRPRVEACSSLPDRAEVLSDYLFYQMNFRGNHDNYYDPRNSYFNCVLDQKIGIPITLSVLYIALARRVGLTAYGIGLPGHFIVGVYAEGSEILVDPFNAGLRINTAQCDRLVRENTGYEGPFQQKWLAPIPPIDLLARMINNLVHSYIRREDWRSAITVLQHLLMLQPESEFHLRDLGYLHLYDGSLRLSAQYLEEYLRRAPDASDFENVRTSLQIVAGRLSLWN